MPSLSPSQANELESVIARTALRYDLLPYTSNPFPQSQPARLSALARLFGLSSVPVSRARVLELGCASGGNLIPHAARNPAAEFVGVDLSRAQVAAGRTRISNLGLRNVKILCQSFTELGAADGVFDYIICHGVYSWVPDLVRQEILRICSERLSPDGIAMISYNVLPGWRMLQVLRDSFLLHVDDQGDSRRRVGQARDILRVLKEHCADGGAYKQQLVAWADRLERLPDDYVEHEFLGVVNDPCTFKDFITAADRFGLAFLGEAELSSMLVDNLAPATAAKVRELGKNQLIPCEQYSDMVTGRTFRQTLLVAAGRAAGINRNLAPARVDGLSFLAGGDLAMKSGGGARSMIDGAGRTLTGASDAVMDALAVFLARLPASSTVDDLIAGLPDALRMPQNRDALLDTLFKMAAAGIVTLTAEPVPAVSAPREKPVACPLIRGDLASGAMASANLRHELVTFDSLGQLVVPLLDGTRTADDIKAAVLAAVSAGRLTFSREGVPISAPGDLLAVVDEHVRALLANCARLAVLTG